MTLSIRRPFPVHGYVVSYLVYTNRTKIRFCHLRVIIDKLQFLWLFVARWPSILGNPEDSMLKYLGERVIYMPKISGKIYSMSDE